MVPVVVHETTDGDVAEKSVIIGDHIIAELHTLSIVSLFKCVRLDLKSTIKCLGKDGYKDVKQEAGNSAGKKAADNFMCGDLTDIIGNLFGDEACHAGETQEEIDAWKRAHPEQFSPPVLPVAPPPEPPVQGTPVSAVRLGQGPKAPAGYYYAIVLTGFTANSDVSVSCHDSVDPSGFRTFTLHTDGTGSASTQSQCYSGDGPDHWVVAGDGAVEVVSTDEPELAAADCFEDRPLQIGLSGGEEREPRAAPEQVAELAPVCPCGPAAHRPAGRAGGDR